MDPNKLNEEYQNANENYVNIGERIEKLQGQLTDATAGHKGQEEIDRIKKQIDALYAEYDQAGQAITDAYNAMQAAGEEILDDPVSLEEQYSRLIDREDKLSKEIMNLSGAELEAKLPELEQLEAEMNRVEAEIKKVEDSEKLEKMEKYREASEEFNGIYRNYVDLAREIDGLKLNNGDPALIASKTEELNALRARMDNEAGDKLTEAYWALNGNRKEVDPSEIYNTNQTEGEVLDLVEPIMDGPITRGPEADITNDSSAEVLDPISGEDEHYTVDKPDRPYGEPSLDDPEFMAEYAYRAHQENGLIEHEDPIVRGPEVQTNVNPQIDVPTPQAGEKEPVDDNGRIDLVNPITGKKESYVFNDQLLDDDSKVKVNPDVPVEGSFEPFVIDISDIDKIRIDDMDFVEEAEKRLEVLLHEQELMNNPYYNKYGAKRGLPKLQEERQQLVDERNKIYEDFMTEYAYRVHQENGLIEHDDPNIAEYDARTKELDEQIALIDSEIDRRNRNEVPGLGKRQIAAQIKLIREQISNNQLAMEIAANIDRLEAELESRNEKYDSLSNENLQELGNRLREQLATDPSVKDEYNAVMDEFNRRNNPTELSSMTREQLESTIDKEYIRLSKLNFDPLETEIDSREVYTQQNGEEFVRERTNLVVSTDATFKFSNGTYISFAELSDVIDKVFEDFTPTHTVEFKQTGRTIDVDQLKEMIVEASIEDSIIRVDERRNGKFNNRNVALKERDSLTEDFTLEGQEYTEKRNLRLQDGFLEGLPNDEMANDYFVRLEAIQKVLEPLGIKFDNTPKPKDPTPVGPTGPGRITPPGGFRTTGPGVVPPIGGTGTPTGDGGDPGTGDPGTGDTGTPTGDPTGTPTGTTPPTGPVPPVPTQDPTQPKPVPVGVDDPDITDQLIHANNDMLARYYGDRRLEKAYRAAMKLYKSHVHFNDDGSVTLDDFPERANIERTFHLEDFEDKITAVSEFQQNNNDVHYREQIEAARILGFDLAPNLHRADFESDAEYESKVIEQLYQADLHYIQSMNENYNSFAETQENLKTLGKHGEWKPYLKLTRNDKGRVKISLGNAVKIVGNVFIGSLNVFKVWPNKMFGTLIAAPIQKLIHNPAKKAAGAYNNKRSHRYTARVEYFTQLLQHKLSDKCKEKGRNPTAGEMIALTYKARLKALIYYKLGNQLVTKARTLQNAQNIMEREMFRQSRASKIAEINGEIAKNNEQLAKLNEAFNNTADPNEKAKIDAQRKEIEAKNAGLSKQASVLSKAKLEGRVTTQVDAVSEDIHKKANKQNVTNVVTGVKMVGKVVLAKIAWENLYKQVVDRQWVKIKDGQTWYTDEFSADKARNLTVRDILDKTKATQGKRNTYTANPHTEPACTKYAIGLQYRDEMGNSFSCNNIGVYSSSGVRLATTTIDAPNGIGDDVTVWEIVAQIQRNSGIDPTATADEMFQRLGSTPEKLEQFLSQMHVLGSNTTGKATSGWVPFIGELDMLNLYQQIEHTSPALWGWVESHKEIMDSKMLVALIGLGASVASDIHDLFRRNNNKEPEMKEYKEKGELDPERVKKEADERVATTDAIVSGRDASGKELNIPDFTGTRSDYQRDEVVVSQIEESVAKATGRSK